MELIEDSNDVYDRVVAGDCTFGGVFVVDGRIPELSLNRVEDPGIMLPYNVSFTMSDELYQQAPAEFEKLAGVVLDPLDLATMTGLTRQVDRMGVPDAAVAEAFLVDQGLIG